jgi:hypothetical protein
MYMKPAINQIEYQLDRLDYCLATNMHFEFTLRDLLNVAASEALLAFMIYGSARLHEYTMCRDLGIVRHKFREIGSSVGGALAITPDICTGVCRFGQLLEYTPRVDLTELIKVPGRLADLNFLENAGSVSRGEVTLPARAIVELIIRSSVLQQKRRYTGRLQETHKRVYNENVVLQSSTEFVNWLVNVENQEIARYHPELSWLIRKLMEIGRYYFNEEKLKFAVVEELESSLLRGYSYIHFPTPPNSRIVIPFEGFRRRGFPGVDLTKLTMLLVKSYSTFHCRRACERFETQRLRFGIRKLMQLCSRVTSEENLRGVKMNDIMNYVKEFTLRSTPGEPSFILRAWMRSSRRV